MKNEPEEYREIEQKARSVSAEIAADMIKHPRARWILGPLRRMMKWIERQCDAALKEDGWR